MLKKHLRVGDVVVLTGSYWKATGTKTRFTVTPFMVARLQSDNDLWLSSPDSPEYGWKIANKTPCENLLSPCDLREGDVIELELGAGTNTVKITQGNEYLEFNLRTFRRTVDQLEFYVWRCIQRVDDPQQEVSPFLSEPIQYDATYCKPLQVAIDEAHERAVTKIRHTQQAWRPFEVSISMHGVLEYRWN